MFRSSPWREARHEPASLPAHAAGGRHHLYVAAGRRVLAGDRPEDRQAARRLPAVVGAAGCRWGCGVTGRTFTPAEDRIILNGHASNLEEEGLQK